MNLAADKIFDPDLEGYVDPETGEILEDAPREMNPKVVPAIMTKLRALDIEIQELNDYANEINLRVAARKSEIQKQVDNGEAFVIALLNLEGVKAKKLPGIGTARVKESTALDDSEFRELPEADKKILLVTYSDFFPERVVRTNPPDKKAIKVFIAEGKKLPGFCMAENPAYLYTKFEPIRKDEK